MTINRRQFLLFMGATATVVACGLKSQQTPAASALKFQPVKLPIPLPNDGVAAVDQAAAYQTYEVMDDLVLPDGYVYDLIAAWGDPVGASHFGYNNDFVAFVPTEEDAGLLTVNFEYVSAATWMQTYAQVFPTELPLAEVQTALSSGSIDAFALADGDDLKTKIQAIAQAALMDQGIGVIAVQRSQTGTWQREPGNLDRRITGVSGWQDGPPLRATGPGVAIFTKAEKQGYDDNLGAQIIGSFGNCAGGQTPWGTAISAEENIQNQVPEAVYADGSAFAPAAVPFQLTEKRLSGLGNPFGLAGNKYGWVVEVDPSNPDDPGTKHTWLGRYRHEAVAVRAVAQKPLAVYSGCDRKGGHLYKFISQDPVTAPTDKANSKLLGAGMLYGAQFDANGTGKWIPLQPETAVDPVRPSQVAGGALNLPNPEREQGGWVKVTEDADAAALAEQFATLGDLYQGNNPTEKQGAILIDAHYAANAAGITCLARPEDTTIDPGTGALFVAFTSGSPDKNAGGPDQRIFKGPNGETPYEFGWIMKLTETDNDPAALTFEWEMIALGGEPADGGLGFANPDNLEIDKDGNLWMVTDLSTGKHNAEIRDRTEDVSQSQLRGLFGNNTAWVIPLTGEQAGQAVPFAIGPMECELCGLRLTPDQEALFLAIQHPGELHGIRKYAKAATREFAVKTTTGEIFTQNRTVPLGSNWPNLKDGDVPKPALVAVRRQQGGTLV